MLMMKVEEKTAAASDLKKNEWELRAAEWEPLQLAAGM